DRRGLADDRRVRGSRSLRADAGVIHQRTTQTKAETMVPYQNTAHFQPSTRVDVTVIGDDEIELEQYVDNGGALLRGTQTASVQQVIDLITVLSQAVSAAVT